MQTVVWDYLTDKDSWFLINSTYHVHELKEVPWKVVDPLDKAIADAVRELK